MTIWIVIPSYTWDPAFKGPLLNLSLNHLLVQNETSSVLVMLFSYDLCKYETVYEKVFGPQWILIK